MKGQACKRDGCERGALMPRFCLAALSSSPIPTPQLRHGSLLWRCFGVLLKSSSFATSLEPPGSPKRDTGFTFERAPEGARAKEELSLSPCHKRKSCQSMQIAAVEMHEQSCKSLLLPTYSRSSKPTRDRTDKWGGKAYLKGTNTSF